MSDIADRYRSRLESLSKTEAEIAQEKASSLGRTARQLEALLAELERLGAAFAAASAASTAGQQKARSELCARHAEVRQRAETQRWYLIVQREAMGLRQHGLVERLYPLPPRLC